MKNFINKCIKEVCNHQNTLCSEPITEDDVFVVWSCKTIQNKKALLGTPVSESRYYECTYNGNVNELYIDIYNKETKRVLKEVF